MPKQYARNLTDAYRKLNFCLGLPVPRKNHHTPWGYKPSETDEGMFDPIDEDLQILWKGYQYNGKHYSLLNVAEWISYHATSPVSKAGLYEIWKNRPPYKEILLPLDERMKLGVDFYKLREQDYLDGKGFLIPFSEEPKQS